MPSPRTLLALIGAAALPAAIAQTAPPAAATCRACHGAEGISAAADIPNLAGQKQAYLAAQLAAFREGRRKNELMNAIAAQLAAEDIQALAAYWSALPAGGSGAAANTALASAVRFPAGFPSGFTEYQRNPSDDGKTVQAFLANEAALAAARAGAPLPDGSMIVGVTTDTASGAVRGYSVMASQAGWGAAVPALLRNGNWQYGLFAADGTPRIGSAHARCLACHQPIGAKSHVFTLDALAERACRP
jgi:cytochrome c553